MFDLGSKSISGTAVRIFTKISALVELCKDLINHAFICGSHKGPFPWQTLKVAK